MTLASISIVAAASAADHDLPDDARCNHHLYVVVTVPLLVDSSVPICIVYANKDFLNLAHLLHAVWR